MLFELTKVEYRYSDGTPALQKISLTIDSGDHVAIIGANGSGKSTLLRILNGILFPDSGQVRFEGEEVTERSLANPEFNKRFRQCVGFVFQNADAQLFNATVFEEVAFGPRQLGLKEAEVKMRTDDVLNFLGIHHLADRPPFRLSGGEKRKVAIASILSMNPQVLIFDEPFLGLDPRSQSWLVHTLKQLQSAGKTTIIATHTLEILPRLATEAIVLSETHEVLAKGPVALILGNRDLLIQANLASFGE